MPKNKNLVYTLLAFAAGLGVWFYTRDRAESPAPAPAPVEAAAIHTAPGAPPVSVRELLNNLTETGDALPAQTGNFKGYLGQDQTAALSRTGKTANFSLNDKPAGVDKIFRFKDDPDSLVLKLGEEKFVYLKFRADAQLEAYPQPLRIWTGWSVSKKGAGAPLVLIEDIQKNWPRGESLRELVPAALPY